MLHLQLTLLEVTWCS